MSIIINNVLRLIRHHPSIHTTKVCQLLHCGPPFLSTSLFYTHHRFRFHVPFNSYPWLTFPPSSPPAPRTAKEASFSFIFPRHQHHRQLPRLLPPLVASKSKGAKTRRRKIKVTRTIRGQGDRHTPKEERDGRREGERVERRKRRDAERGAS
ncbi:hypothetical protein IWX90DRAFT_107340 [Phyllosticta citrichinensis]|uniref:C2H2-type domain-containing protein n=1 Tax=Phyllosticta citrichinensis TaxID=1130410 RepID=A0ABR1Y2H9_9PEZI